MSSQVQEGQEKVIAYYIKCFSRTERKYCTTRKELLAIVSSVKHLHTYLYGRHFTVPKWCYSPKCRRYSRRPCSDSNCKYCEKIERRNEANDTGLINREDGSTMESSSVTESGKKDGMLSCCSTEMDALVPSSIEKVRAKVRLMCT